MQFPPLPDLPADQIATGRAHLRYEDVSQDGRLNLNGLPPAMGQVVWRTLLGDHGITREGRDRGVVPILTRFVMVGEETTVPVGRPLQTRGAYQLSHTRGDDGQVNRLILELWTEVSGVQGRTYAPPPPGHGEMVKVGTIYAHHVFTRPFAGAGQRKVLSFEDPELPALPPAQHDWQPLQATLALPPGARPIDEQLSPAGRVSFGLYQTDSNQHVNSLVYPRLFEQAVLERLADRGQSTAVLSRAAEVSYRKPCFAGDQVHIVLATYELGDRIGAVGCFVDQPITGDADAVAATRPRCYLHMELAR